jgi:hypothetical protein
MAVVEQILGSTMNIIKDGIVVGCATDFSLNVTAKELDASCSGSGNLDQAKVGRKKVTFDVGGLWKQSDGADVATNVTANEFFDNILAGTEVTIVIGKLIPVVGDITYTGTGYLKDVKLSGNDNELGKYTCSGWFNTIAATETLA